MELEEMIERAQQIRSRDSFGAVTEEERVAFVTDKEDFYIHTEHFKVHVYRFTPKEARSNRPMLINLHGGGFIKGHHERDELFCARIAEKMGCEVVDIDYSLAPEHPYPYAVNETYEAVEWLFMHAAEWGVDPTRIALFGQSAGGNLAATVVIRSGEAESIRPCGITIGWAPLDLYTDPTTKWRHPNDMPADRAKLYNRFYCKEKEAKEILASPFFAETEHLKHFPKTLIISAGEDSLALENEAFGLNLARAGVEVTGERFVNSMHGFLINRMAEWEAAQDYLERFLGEVFR